MNCPRGRLTGRLAGRSASSGAGPELRSDHLEPVLEHDSQACWNVFRGVGEKARVLSSNRGDTQVLCNDLFFERDTDRLYTQDATLLCSSLRGNLNFLLYHGPQECLLHAEVLEKGVENSLLQLDHSILCRASFLVPLASDLVSEARAQAPQHPVSPDPCHQHREARSESAKRTAHFFQG